MRQINLNPIVNGRRVLADDFVRVFGVANVLSNVNVRAGINRRPVPVLKETSMRM